jgi:RNA polymerase sigma-70 factor (ECF subfamily)
MSEKTDRDLMGKAAAGDRAAFAQIFKKYYPWILNFFWRLVWDHSTAQELAQDVFLRLWKKRKSFAGTGKFSTYLFQIAKNHWVNQLRRKKRFQDFIDAKKEELKREDRTGVPGPDRELEKKEIEEVVRKAIKSLPDNYRVPFVLSRYNRFKYRDIAEILGISPRTVEWRIAQAFSLLGRKLAKLKES